MPPHTRLGRWCLQASEHYGARCKPEIKQLQNAYDHGFETMKPEYFKSHTRPSVAPREPTTRDPVSMLLAFFH